MKRLTAVLLMLFTLLTFAACGNTSPDGTWVLTEKLEANGEKISGDQIDWTERFEFTGESGSYTLQVGDIDKTYDVTLEKADNGEYNILLKGTLMLGRAKFSGKKMSYDVGDGSNTSTFVFEKQ